MARQSSASTKIGNTPGGRGPLPANIKTMSDYYNAGLSSPSNPGATVRNQDGKVVSGSAKS